MTLAEIVEHLEEYGEETLLMEPRADYDDCIIGVGSRFHDGPLAILRSHIPQMPEVRPCRLSCPTWEQGRASVTLRRLALGPSSIVAGSGVPRTCNSVGSGHTLRGREVASR